VQHGLATATVNGTIFPAGYTAETASVYSDENTVATFEFIKMEFFPNSIRKLKCNSNRSNLSLQKL
jgi:hypothetical protein